MEDALLSEFVNESREHLATIEADLLTIEEAGAGADETLVNKVFRAAHSIKGGSAFFGLTKVKELAHKAETVLDMLRAGKMSPNAEITNVLLAAFDKLREMINNHATQEQADITDLVVALSGLASSYLPLEQKASLTQTVALHRPGEENIAVTLPQVDLDRAQRSGQFVYCVDLDLIHDIERKGKNVLAVFRDIWETGEILDCNLDFEAVGTLDGPLVNQLLMRLTFATIIRPEEIDALIEVSRDKVKILFDPNHAPSSPMSPTAEIIPPPTPERPLPCPPEPVSAARAVHPASAKPGGSEAPPPAETQAPSTSGDSTLRVNVGLLETLMNLAGELVLSRNQLRAAIATKDVQSLNVADQRFNLVTSELQEAIMQTRLQPIGNVFAKFPRVVRDMANALHKDIQLDIQGKDVALDRSLIEGLSDPLTHMVRNAVDHGIETPEIRLRAGKKGQGLVRIEARHEAGQVVVEISDDGKGIDPAKVAQAALDKGLITAEKLRGMSLQDKIALVLLPGLSTAKTVTDISGRGVGMDVVKTNLNRLGGKIEITSEIGKGSLFRIKLPLTLAIIPSLIISVGQERFAIPQINVEELLQIRSEEVKQRIETVGGAQVLLLRDKILPLVYMDRLLGVVSAGPDSNGNVQAKSPPAPLEIAVVTTGAVAYGLVVSSFHETEEIVVKPLGRHLKGLCEYAGATILGDGTVALILDITGVAAKAEFAGAAGTARGQELADEAARTRLEETHSLLLFQNSPGEVCAIPLDTVLRIERTTPERVEMVGSRRTIQYRGASLPLVTLSDAARVNPLGESRDLAVIVANVRGREVGLLGAMPVDVVETKTLIDQTTHRQTGIAGSAIIRDKTTLIADVFELIDTVYPEWKEVRASLPATAGQPATNGNPVLLLAEDSDFFRAQIKQYLEQDGFTVLEAPDGQAAWELLLDHVQEICAVVTDIEMPRLTGLELTQRIRGDARLGQLPVIALSSLAADEDIARSKAAGANEHLVKLDRDLLLSTIHSVAGHN
jgi:two-component system, chemotaxis family, sensor kinase CheA